MRGECRCRKLDADRQLIAQMRRLVELYPCFGSERVHQLLLQTGLHVNFKRVHRIRKLEHMQVPKKQHKKRRLPGTSINSCIRHKPTHPNHASGGGRMVTWKASTANCVTSY
jgi:hypothetical protein